MHCQAKSWQLHFLNCKRNEITCYNVELNRFLLFWWDYLDYGFWIFRDLMFRIISCENLREFEPFNQGHLDPSFFYHHPYRELNSSFWLTGGRRRIRVLCKTTVGHVVFSSELLRRIRQCRGNDECGRNINVLISSTWFIYHHFTWFVEMTKWDSNKTI